MSSWLPHHTFGVAFRYSSVDVRLLWHSAYLTAEPVPETTAPLPLKCCQWDCICFLCVGEPSWAVAWANRPGRDGCSAERGAVPRPGPLRGSTEKRQALWGGWWLLGPGRTLSSASCLRKVLFALTDSSVRKALSFTCLQIHLFLQVP